MKTPPIKTPTIALRLFWLMVLAASLTVSRAATYTVTITNDASVGSLRWAIGEANTNAGTDTINFSLPGTSAIVLALGLKDDEILIPAWRYEQTGENLRSDPRIELLFVARRAVPHSDGKGQAARWPARASCRPPGQWRNESKWFSRGRAGCWWLKSAA